MRRGRQGSGRIVVQYGYQVGEVPLKRITKPSEGFKMSIIRDNFDRRSTSGVSLGPFLYGATLPRPNLTHPMSLVAGVCARFAGDPDDAMQNIVNNLLRDELFAELAAFTLALLLVEFTPLSGDADITLETWLANSNYPLGRRDDLRRTFNELYGNFWDTVKTFVKQFCKDESYTDYKHCRPINSRHDETKVLIGPIIAAVEKEVFKSPQFIKKVPANQRANYIRDRFAPMMRRAGVKIVTTDYTSFESLQTADLWYAVHYVCYKYFTQFLPCHNEFLSFMERIKAGTNKIYNKCYSMEIESKLMSGEMDTSLGNTLLNYILMKFACNKFGSECVGVVEGDDGLFAIDGPVPTSDFFQTLGLNIKMEEHDSLATASFCGQVFDPDEMSQVTDPKEIMASIGWTNRKYLKASRSKRMTLLRMKSLSYLYQYPNCPIVSKMCEAYLSATRGYDVRSLANSLEYRNTYERDLYLQAVSHKKYTAGPVGPNTRLLVERVFNVDVTTQLRYENYFTKLSEYYNSISDSKQLSNIVVDPIPLWFDVPASWKHNFENYVVVEDMDNPLIEQPILPITNVNPALFQTVLKSERYGKITRVFPPEHT
jgi:hypothetical protein